MNEFNDAMFKTKVDNIFVKILTAITNQDLSEVEHFISTNIKDKLQSSIDNLKLSGDREIYDEINAKETNILNRSFTDDKEIIEVEIISRYMNYIINKEGETISGDDTRRIEKKNILVFEKKKDVKETKIVRKCPGCGASISVNTSGKCEYCDTIYNLEDYDYVLTSIKTY